MFILKLIGYYLRHPKQLAAGLWRKFKRIPPVHAIGVTAKAIGKASRTEERVKALEEELAALAKENAQLKERVGRLEKDKTIRKKSALESLARAMAEETAEKRAADPKRLEAYGKVIERIREGSDGTVCAVDLGCGQGFWAREMEKQGLSVVCVDNEDAAVQACREKQLNAVRADEAEWMRNCQSEAADLITVMQKAGAIGPEKTVAILTEAARVLRPGGAVIIEDGKQAIGSPVTAETLTAAAKHAGLKTETVKFGSDYAVIGWKTE